MDKEKVADIAIVLFGGFNFLFLLVGLPQGFGFLLSMFGALEGLIYSNILLWALYGFIARCNFVISIVMCVVIYQMWANNTKMERKKFHILSWIFWGASIPLHFFVMHNLGK